MKRLARVIRKPVRTSSYPKASMTLPCHVAYHLFRTMIPHLVTELGNEARCKRPDSGAIEKRGRFRAKSRCWLDTVNPGNAPWGTTAPRERALCVCNLAKKLPQAHTQEQSKLSAFCRGCGLSLWVAA